MLLRRSPLLAAAAGLAVLALVGCSRSAGDEAPEDRLAERAFVGALLPAHESTLRLALDAQERAERPELRSFARRMEETRRREISQLEAAPPVGRPTHLPG